MMLIMMIRMTDDFELDQLLDLFLMMMMMMTMMMTMMINDVYHDYVYDHYYHVVTLAHASYSFSLYVSSYEHQS